MPRISIIVPVYNVEPYLRRCVDSIFAQTFTDFELILVDDGSPDGCPAICDEYAEKDSRVRVIHKENGGVSSARNAGMEVAEGKYFLFCDSDDYVSPQWCEALYVAAEGNPDCLAFGGINRMWPENTGLESNTTELERALYPKSRFLCFHAEGIAGFAWNAMFNAEIIKKYAVAFRTDVIVEDLPFCLEYLRHVTDLFYCGHAGYYYVQRNIPTLSRKYYQDGFRKYQEKYVALQKFIDDCATVDQGIKCHEELANEYMYLFLKSLDNTFDSRSSLIFFQKLKYNQRVIKTKEFRDCIQNYTAGRENERYLRLLRCGNYYIAYLYTFGARIKERLFKQARRIQ